MIHVDPAHPEFEGLPRQIQASIYRSMGWSLGALADEFGVRKSTVQYWVNPDYKARHIADKTERRRRGTAA